MSQTVLQVTRNTQTLSDLRSKKCRPEGWAQGGSEYTYGQMHVYLTYKVYIWSDARVSNLQSIYIYGQMHVYLTYKVYIWSNASSSNLQSIHMVKCKCI
jgi:hypothetical protein